MIGSSRKGFIYFFGRVIKRKLKSEKENTISFQREFSSFQKDREIFEIPLKGNGISIISRKIRRLTTFINESSRSSLWEERL